MSATADLYTLGLEIRSDGVVTASDRLKELANSGAKAETATNALTNSFDQLKGYVQAAVAAMAAWKITSYINEATLLSARVETLSVVMTVVGKNAYYSKTQMEEFANGLKKMGITTQEAYSNMTKMTQANLDLTQSSKLARVAQDAAVIGNINSSEAFARMIQGIRSGETEILRNIGLQVNMEQAYKKYATANGLVASALTETQKVQARANAVLEEGSKIAGTYEASMTTAGKMLNSMARLYEELKLAVGNVFLEGFTDKVNLMTDALKWANKNIDEMLVYGKVLAGALGGLLIVVTVVKGFELLSAAIVAMTAAMRAAAITAAFVGPLTAAAAAANEAAAAATLFGRALSIMGGPLGILIGLLLAAAGAWMAYIDAKDKAMDKASKGPADEADRLAQEIIELREKNRLMGLTKEQAKDETEAKRANERSALLKEQVQLQSRLNEGSAAYEGGDLYGEKADADAARLKTVEKLIATLPGLRKEDERQIEINKKLREKMNAKATPVVPGEMEDPEHYSREVKKAAEAWEKYQDEIRNRELAADKNHSDLRLAALKRMQSMQLISERSFQEQSLADAEMMAQKTVDVMDKKWQVAREKADKIAAALKPQADGTLAEGLVDGVSVGVADRNQALAAMENARIAKEAAETKLAAARSELEMYPVMNAAIDERAKKELEIQLLEVRGYTEAATDAKNELKYAKLLFDTKNEALVQLTREIDLINNKKAAEAAARSASDSVKALQNQTVDNEIKTISDPIEQKQAQINAAYQREMEQIAARVAAVQNGYDREIEAIANKEAREIAAIEKVDALRKLADSTTGVKKYDDAKLAGDSETAKWEAVVSAAKKAAPQLSMLDGLVAAAHGKYEEDKEDKTKLSTKGQLEMTSAYAAGASQLFGGLAASVDQSSRDGFDSAKAFNMASAVMSTASAIMQAYAQLGPIAGTVAAVGIAALGALQISQIASTTYGGGSGSAAFTGSAGSFGGTGQSDFGGVGSSIGSNYTSVHDSQTYDSLKGLADAADNASLAIGKVSDGLTKLADLFSEGSMASASLSMAPGIQYAQVDPKGWMSKIGEQFKYEISNWGKSILTAGVFGIVNMFKKGDWGRQMGGINLGVDAGQLSGQEWTQWARSGGLFKGTENAWTTNAIDKGFMGTMENQLTRITSQIARAAVAMGTTVDFNKASLPGAVIQTSGRTQEEITKDVTAFFTDAAGAFALTMDGLKEFSYYGENAYDAAMRLATALQSTNEGLDQMGVKLIDSTLTGANAAYKLQDLMGGAEKFTTAIENYMSSMFTSEEQAARKAATATKAVNAAFGEMGVAVPATKEGFNALVESLDVTTERGAQLFAALMDVSTSFATVQDQIIAMNEAIKSSMEDLVVRGLTVAGKDDQAGLFSLIYQHESELADYRLKGIDTTQLLIVQQKEWDKALLDTTKNMVTAGKMMTEGTKKMGTELSATLNGVISITNTLLQMRTKDSALSPTDKLKTSKELYLSTLSKTGVGTNAERAAAMGQVGGQGLDYLENAKTYYGTNSKEYQDIYASIDTNLSNIISVQTDATVSELQNLATILTTVKSAVDDGTIATGALDTTTLTQLQAIIGTTGRVPTLLTTFMQSTAEDRRVAKEAADKAIVEANSERDRVLNIGIATKNLNDAFIRQATKQQAFDNASNAAAAKATINSQDETNTGSIKYQEKIITDKQALYKFAENRYNEAFMFGDIGEQQRQSAIGNALKVQIAAANSAIKVLTDQLPALNLLAGTVESTAGTLASENTYIRQMQEWLHALGAPGYAVGTSYVSNDMLANIHQGEIIVDPRSSDILRRYGIQVNGSADEHSGEQLAEQKNTTSELKALVRLQSIANEALLNKLTAVEARLAGIETEARLAA